MLSVSSSLVTSSLDTMIRALTKTRPANYYANQVKVLLLIVIAILFWNSDNARNFTADTFSNASQIIRAN